MWVYKIDPQIPKIQTSRRIADVKSKIADWKVKHKISDAHTKRAVNSIVDSVMQTRNATQADKITQAIATGSTGLAETAVPWDIFQAKLSVLTDLQLQVMDLTGEAMTDYIPPEIGTVNFTTSSPRALAFATAQGANLVVQITEETKLALRNQILIATREGLGVDQTAKNLINLIGLTDRQAGAVTRFRRSAIANGMKVSKADKLAREYSARLLDYRAHNIARTELLRASNEGHQEMINQAIDQGLVNTNNAMKEWIVTPDDRLCEYCRPMDGVQVKLNENFSTPYGTMQTGPMHPMCRCVIGLVFPKNKL